MIYVAIKVLATLCNASATAGAFFIYREHSIMKNLLKVLKRKAEDIYYSDTNIYLNGKLIKPSALPVFSDDTFYIPIDLLNEIQKNEIHIDEKNVFIGTPPSQKEPINDICPPCT